MSVKLLSIVVMSTVGLTLTAQAKPLSQDELLPSPEGLVCWAPSSDEASFDINWSILEGAKKYAIDLECDVQGTDGEGVITPLGKLELETSLKSGECSGEVCGVTINNDEVSQALTDLIQSGEIVPPENTSIGVICTANVKGLNPPGKSQNHPKGSANCQLPVQNECPVWTAEQLADIGNHELVSNGLIRFDDDTQFSWSGNGLIDYEQGYDAAGHYIMDYVYVDIDRGSYGAADEYYGGIYHDGAAHPEANISVWMELTLDQYEACRQQILDHAVKTLEPVAACPAWSLEELQDIGSHGLTTIEKLDNDTTTLCPGCIGDYERGSNAEGNITNYAFVALPGYPSSTSHYVSYQHYGVLHPEGDVQRSMEVSPEEYEFCKQQLLEHDATQFYQ